MPGGMIRRGSLADDGAALVRFLPAVQHAGSGRRALPPAAEVSIALEEYLAKHGLWRAGGSLPSGEGNRPT